MRTPPASSSPPKPTPPTRGSRCSLLTTLRRLYVALTRGAPRSARPRALGDHRRRHRPLHVRSQEDGAREVGSRRHHPLRHRARLPGPPPGRSPPASPARSRPAHPPDPSAPGVPGAPCLGDPAYGSGPPPRKVRAAMAEAGLKRQALRTAVLGFRHPVTGETLRFESHCPRHGDAGGASGQALTFHRRTTTRRGVIAPKQWRSPHLNELHGDPGSSEAWRSARTARGCARG